MNRIVIALLLIPLILGMPQAALIEPVAESMPAPTNNPNPYPERMPPSQPSPANKEGKEKISLDLRGMDILNVLKILSQKSGLQIIAGKDVRGTVNIFIENVDPLVALQMILESNDLAYEEDSGLIKVITEQEYEKKYGHKFKDQRQMKIIQTKYMKPDELVPLLSQVKTSAGQIIPNNKSNSVIVLDLPEVIQKMELMANEVDQNEKEVLIESRIVQVMLNDEYKIGVDWKQVFTNVNAIGPNANAGVEFKLGSIIDKGGMGVRGELQVGAVTGNNYNVVLSALETVGKTNLLSSPRIAVLNNKEARILVGTKQAYVTTTVVTSGSGVSTTAESITFLDVGVKLYVTPVISRDGFVTLKIRPEVSSVFDTLITSSGNKIPLVRTTETETTISVKDGTTVIIAGLVEEQDMKTQNMIPLLGKIPLLGNFFSGTNKTKSKTELVILMTPRIISGAENIIEKLPSEKK